MSLKVEIVAKSKNTKKRLFKRKIKSSRKLKTSSDKSKLKKTKMIWKLKRPERSSNFLKTLFK